MEPRRLSRDDRHPHRPFLKEHHARPEHHRGAVLASTKSGTSLFDVIQDLGIDTSDREALQQLGAVIDDLIARGLVVMTADTPTMKGA